MDLANVNKTGIFVDIGKKISTNLISGLMPIFPYCTMQKIPILHSTVVSLPLDAPVLCVIINTIIN